ncbi:MAG TPA: hypothetical protein VHO02_03550 [Fibrobacteria bacterium]|nr:hypothetical protein [Fibrobacteria bacterium]
MKQASENGILRIALAGSAVLLAFGIVVSTLYVVAVNFHPVVFRDSWETVPLFQAYLRGEPILGRMWEPWYRHRIFFPRILYLLDFRLAGGTGSLLVGASLLLQGGLAILVALALRRQTGLSAWGRVLASSLAVCACFWLVQSGNLLWGFQVAWFLNAFAAFLGAFLACGFRPEASRVEQGVRLACIGLCLITATFSLANGILIGVPLLALLWKGGASRRVLLAGTIFWIVTAVIFFVGLGASAGEGTAEALYSTDSTLPQKFLYVPVYLGNPFSRLHLGAGMALGAAGLGLFAVFCRRWFRSARPGFLESLAWAQMAYTVATAAATAAGRSYFSIGQATSSRYYPPVLLFWLFAGLWGGLAIRKRATASRLAAAVFVGVSAILIAGQLAAVPERKERYLKADNAALALAAGVDDTLALVYLQEHAGAELLRRMRELEPFLKERRLSIYRDRWLRTLGEEPGAAYRIGKAGALRLTALEESPRGSAAEAGAGRFVSGVIEPVAGANSRERLLLVENGRVTGFAATRARACAGCFSGYASGPGSGPLAVYALREGDGDGVVAWPVEASLSP